MAISKEALSALESVVGAKFISDDPAVCEGYRSGPGGYESGLGYERVMTTIPAVVILPRNTEEVQRIVKICCRYKVPYVPYSTGFYGPRSHCHVENELLIDLKRLNDFEIDEKHLFAVVGRALSTPRSSRRRSITAVTVSSVVAARRRRLSQTSSVTAGRLSLTE
jgi:glycolate oxidase